MWPMIAEPGLCCAECRHTIQPGRLCLSDLPEETPVGVSRSDFRNYCIGCSQCWAQGKHACYVRHLDSGRNTGKTPRSLPCARCGRRIGAGEKAAVEIYFDWPKVVEDGESSASKWSALGEADCCRCRHPNSRETGRLFRQAQPWFATEVSECGRCLSSPPRSGELLPGRHPLPGEKPGRGRSKEIP